MDYEAYDEGAEAAFEGHELDHNPYEEGEAQWHSWNQGWENFMTQDIADL